ncbi:hypothetical protein FQP81_18320 [Pseudoalteromonas distincta]|uniref:hypothetical protein n=1 Tax=Pseudoalteromonas TaxID=53246 RepID=UPI000C3284C9|nr:MULTISPECIES: hypothetical protein [Pseudoalteromonas]PKG68628.1 hypothetical protein CXF64_20105 [Pseudoalteromonas sp. GutCa3]TVU70412.1 hypothetical protein FQP81_18320 [Pseudoalteromonas elyakovii]
MFSKFAKAALKSTASWAFECIVDVDESSDSQLDGLNDGMGNFIADGDSYTSQEVTDVKSRGELYDTYY